MLNLLLFVRHWQIGLHFSWMVIRHLCILSSWRVKIKSWVCNVLDSPNHGYQPGLKQVGATCFMKMTALFWNYLVFFTQSQQISSELYRGVAVKWKWGLIWVLEPHALWNLLRGSISNISVTQFYHRCCFGCKLSTKIFNSVC